MDEKALYDFFQTMGDTAVDIYWGNYPGLTTAEQDRLTGEEQEAALNEACAEMAFYEVEAAWYTELPARLAECYGRHLATKYALQIIKEREAKEK